MREEKQKSVTSRQGRETETDGVSERWREKEERKRWRVRYIAGLSGLSAACQI